MRAARLARTAIGNAIVPLFVVVANDRSDRQVRKFYDLGASAVVKWPKEKTILTQLLAELVGVAQVRGKASEPGVALARAVKARLKLSEGLNNELRFRISGGNVHVSGELDSLRRKERLRKAISRVPGVKGVMLEDLRIAASGRSDRAIAGSVRTMLRNTSGVDPATLSIRVQNGNVTLAGTIADWREMNQAIEMIQNVHGVRGIENLTTLSKKKKKQDRSVATRLSRELSLLFPDQQISLSVFGNIAVLNGQVELLVEKQEIEKFISKDASIDRIVNKIEVM
jgi:osmotically-inducible protein OsmY